MVDVDSLSRFFLALYFTVIGVHYTSVALGRAARSGMSHIHSGRTGSSTWRVRQTFNFFRSLILVLCITRLFVPMDDLLLRFDLLYQLPVVSLGISLMLVSLGVVSYVHAYMGNQWRSGLAQQASVLLTKGPYRRSRNPMFIGIIMGQVGFFLVLPSLFTLVCLVAGVIALSRQAQHEEAALTSQLGEQYTHYKTQVPRWL